MDDKLNEKLTKCHTCTRPLVKMVKDSSVDQCIWFLHRLNLSLL